MNERDRNIRQCANDLAYFLSIGWRKADLPILEKLWWETLKYRSKP